jgi:RNA polymerase sigma factor (sigma-70 family)
MHTSPDIIRRCLAGDADALETLIMNIQRRIYNLAVRFLYEPSDAEDATQEILLKVVTHLATFRGESAFETWVHRIAVNHLLNIKRSRQERLTFEEGAYHLERVAAQPESDAPDRHLLAHEVKISCTTSMLMCLSRPQRMAYILGEILALNSTEAAYVLDITPETFRKRLSLARTQIRAFMGAHCGIFNPDNLCRCSKKIDYDIGLGIMTPERLRFADKGDAQDQVERTLHAVETLRDDVEIFRSHPDYPPPERLLVGLKTLIAQRTDEIP